MKTLVLEIDDSAYAHVSNFLRLVPQCRIIEDDPDTLTAAELEQLESARQALQNGDTDAFEDWDTVKSLLNVSS